jgi:hypothetical protein
MGVVTAERFAQGMTFDQYVAYIGSPENLAREAGWWLGRKRQDFSASFGSGTSAPGSTRLRSPRSDGSRLSPTVPPSCS